MANKKLHKILILLFIVYIFAFALLYVFLPHESFSEKEKRALAKFPETSVQTIINGTFESGFETWLSDHIPARDLLVGLNARYELVSGRNGLSGVIYADGTHLIASPESFSEDEIIRKCERINAFAKATGIPTDVMIIPTSGYINNDILPRLHAQYRDADIAAAVSSSLSEDIGFLWPEERLRSIQDVPAYYHTDHHLTSRGSYEVCAEYTESIGLVMPAASDYDVETNEGFYGSMYAKAGLWDIRPDQIEIWHSRNLGSVTVSFDDRESSESMFFMEHLSEMDKYPTFLDGNHALVTIETENDSGENLLLIRDSFGHCFAPFAADNFNRIVLVDLRYYRKPVSQLVEEMKIDRTLVLYGADTFLTDTNFAWLK